MIYLDTSVALAHILGERRAPPARLWDEDLVSSRLFEYELRVRLRARGAADANADSIRVMLGVVQFLELSPSVLGRALQPFPVPIRTLDALHLASADFLLRHGQRVELATYVERMAAAARAVGVPLADI